MLYIRSPELFLITENLYPLINVSSFPPPPASGNHHSIPCYHEFDFFLRFHINEITQYLYFCFWLTSLSMMSSKFIHWVTNSDVKGSIHGKSQ